MAGLGLLAGCGRWPFQTLQLTSTARVGVLANVGVRTTASLTRVVAVLQEHGYVEGQNTVIEFRSAEGRPERLPALAAQLVESPVDVILAAGPPAVRAAQAATRTIPIVMQFTGDPVAAGVVASLARPGGNVTGVTAMGTQLAGKRLELLKATIPQLTRLAVLLVAARGIVGEDELQAAGQTLGLQLQMLAVDIDELEAVFNRMVSSQTDAVLLNGAGG